MPVSRGVREVLLPSKRWCYDTFSSIKRPDEGASAKTVVTLVTAAQPRLKFQLQIDF